MPVPSSRRTFTVEIFEIEKRTKVTGGWARRRAAAARSRCASARARHGRPPLGVAVDAAVDVRAHVAEELLDQLVVAGGRPRGRRTSPATRRRCRTPRPWRAHRAQHSGTAVGAAVAELRRGQLADAADRLQLAVEVTQGGGRERWSREVSVAAVRRRAAEPRQTPPSARCAALRQRSAVERASRARERRSGGRPGSSR